MSKARLEAQQKALEDLWRQGLSGHELLRRHAEMVDEFIVGHLRATPAFAGRVAVVALGGYGRRELYPFSDIDLLLVHDEEAAGSIREVAESILYPLWDSGFEVGHSVRTVKDAVDFAAHDFFFQVSLLDARFLGGSSSLYEELLARYRKGVIDGGQRDFVRTMEKFRAERRAKYGSHGYQLEPHVKEGKGGMRDIQSMLWTARVVFGLSGLDAMEDAGILEPRERAEFEAAWNMLARLRNRLHHVSRRKNDQLVFDYQAEIAAVFGYADSDSMLGVEHFMRDVYARLQTISVVVDFFFDHVREVQGLIGPAGRERRLEPGIVERNGAILPVRPELLSERPHLLMRLFLQAARTGLPLHHRARRLVGANPGLVDEKFRSSRRMANNFFEIMMRGRDPVAVLESMLETGLLTAYIPEYAGVESLAQHDLYHIYTVDRHQLQTVAELVKLREEQEGLFAGLSAPRLLYLAALLHDIGKGKRGDHSELGAVMVAGIAARLGLDAQECETLSFLVKYHLFIPENALRRDLDDQEFISQAAAVIGGVDRLTMLYLLSIADSRATGPSAWSSWKASLLVELFLRVKARLEAAGKAEKIGRMVAGGEQRGVDWLRSAVAGLLAGEAPPRIGIEDLPADYLTSFGPETVAEHLRLHRDRAVRLRQQVLVFAEPAGEFGSLLVMSADRVGLLAKLFGVLALHNLHVLAANIFTWPDGTVVDVVDVAPVLPGGFEDRDWAGLESDFNKVINYRLDVGYQLVNKLGSAVRPGRPAVQRAEQKVVLDNETSRRFSVIEVYGHDRPGTLYKLTQVMTDYGLNIHRAKIATEVEQLINIFYVSTAGGCKITEPGLERALRQGLLAIVGEEAPGVC